MALSQVLCSLALAAILSSTGKTEKRNFWMNEGCLDFCSGKKTIYDLELFFCVLGGILNKRIAYYMFKTTSKQYLV